jgi:phage replication O-like protein O
MASPQVENGYVKIANELYEALIKAPIGNSCSQVIYAVIRKTYGWHKKEDKISISQLCEMTGCSRRTVIYATQNLEAKRMISVNRSKKSGAENNVNTISLNKNYDEWVVQGISPQYRKVLERGKKLYRKRKKGVVQGNDTGGGSASNGKEVVQGTVKDGHFLAPTKDTITKDTITKDIFPCFSQKTGENTVPPKPSKPPKKFDPPKPLKPFYLTKKKRKLKGWKLETFEQFWKAFHWYKDKANASDAWLQIPGLTEELALKHIIPGAARYCAGRPALIAGDHTPKWAQGWLSSRRWEDEKYEDEKDGLDDFLRRHGKT